MDITGKLSDLLVEKDHGDTFKQYVKEISAFLLSPAYKILYVTSDEELSLCERVFEFAKENQAAKFETSFGQGMVVKLPNGGKAFIEYENGLLVLTFHEDYLFHIDTMFNK